MMNVASSVGLSRWVCALVAALAFMVAGSALAQGCKDCGRVQSIRYVEEKGEASGLGAVAGGVVGGVLGHQLGSGRGNTVATVAGAAGGAYAGHKIEQNKNKKGYWAVDIKMDSGGTRTFTYSQQPAVHEGEHVKLVDGGKRLALVAK